MMRATLLLLIFALAAAGVAWFADHPGAVTLTWQGYRIDTSVGILAAAVALVALATAWLYRLWRGLRAMPGAIGRKRRESRRLKGYRALTQGMVAVAAGDATEASRQARRADVLLNEPPLTMLLSAQAAQLNGDEAAAERYFVAMLERPETEFLGLRGLIVQATRKGETARALGYARRARALQPRTGWVLTTLHDLEARSGEWLAAAETARLAVKAKAMAPAASKRYRAIAAYERSRAAEAAGDKSAASKLAREAVDLDPAFVPAVVHAATLLAANDERRRARHLVEDSWALNPHRDLARAYLAIDPSSPPLERMVRMQKLIAYRPDHPESRIALAEAALAARLWGEARRALEGVSVGARGAPSSASREGAAVAAAGDGGAPMAGVCRLWAMLEEAEHGDNAAARSWLARAATARPDPAWVCAQCGAAHSAWQPLCPHCGAYDAMAWRSPAHAAAVEIAPPPEALPPAVLPVTEAPRPAEAATDLGDS